MICSKGMTKSSGGSPTCGLVVGWSPLFTGEKMGKIFAGPVIFVKEEIEKRQELK